MDEATILFTQSETKAKSPTEFETLIPPANLCTGGRHFVFLEYRFTMRASSAKYRLALFAGL